LRQFLKWLLRTMLLLERGASMRIPTWLLALLLVAGTVLLVVLMINVVIYWRSFVLRKCRGSLEAPALPLTQKGLFPIGSA